MYQTCSKKMTYASKLRAILEDAPKTRNLKMELAVTVDCMEPFVKAMYNLEVDGNLALEVVHCYHFQAHAQCESDGQSRSRRKFFVWAAAPRRLCDTCIWLLQGQDLKPALMAFKSAHFFSPSKINTIRPSPSDINDLSVFPFLSSPVIEELKKELPDYLAQAEDVSPSVVPIVWWRDHTHKLPHWSQACKFSRTTFKPLLCYSITIVEWSLFVQSLKVISSNLWELWVLIESIMGSVGAH